MVYVNGPQYHAAARAILRDYPDVTAFYLNDETGDYGSGGSMADVFAGAPFLTRADWIFYLDDDNFFDSDHVASLMNLARENDLKWAYSLRRFVSQEGNAICDDDFRSLGHWPVVGTDGHLVDNSCYAVSRRLAQRMSLAWTAIPLVADRCFFMALERSGARYGCTGLSTVNYRIGTGSAQETPEHYLNLKDSVQGRYPGGFPWRKPRVFGSGV